MIAANPAPDAWDRQFFWRYIQMCPGASAMASGSCVSTLQLIATDVRRRC
jgi:hypothetical protein